MQEKQLKPLPIVPADIYVERSADRQLKRILSDMGRPGYVLVARQMGKTNLLLNSKRAHEDSNHLFVYLDLANQLPDLRSFYRNIVDSIIDISSIRVETVAASIYKNRAEYPKPPHKEHEFELRQLLTTVSGTLIICLDEIDALTKSGFSDQVFTFIRSIYFSGRSNFPEFKRLTYILSGVAEPADIIKNKDISPFNIGERIYLEDFTRGEASKLISKSLIPPGLGLEDRIFHWTNGHPRMTWDIGSCLEDLVLKGESVSASTVDDIVSDLYLSELDNPPIDHIRRIAEESQEVRDALIDIHWFKGERVSASARTKLYLAGITRMSQKLEPLSFKNKILEQVLSQAFLQSFPSNSVADWLESGAEAYREGDYSGAARCYRTALKNSSKETESIAYIGLCRSLYRGGAFEGLTELLANPDTATVRDFTQDDQIELDYLRGSSYLQLHQYGDAASALQRAIGHSESKFYFDAVSDFIEAGVIAGDRNTFDKIDNLCRKAIDSRTQIFSKPSGYKPPPEIFARLNLSMSRIFLRRKAQDRAVSSAQTGLDHASSINTKILLLMALYDAGATNSRGIALRQCIVTLKQCKGFSDSAFGKDECVEVNTLFDLLFRLSSAQRSSETEEVLQHVLHESKAGLSVAKILDSLAEFAISRGENGLCVKIMEASLALGISNFTNLELRSIYQFIFTATPDKVNKYGRVYLESFSEENPVRPEDGLFIFHVGFGIFAAGNGPTISKSITLLREIPTHNSEISILEISSIKMVANYLQVLASFATRPAASEIAAAKSLYEKLSTLSEFSFPGFPVGFPKIMQANIAPLLKQHGVQPNIKRGLKIGRNDYVTVRYGEVMRHGKFKKFEFDIQNGTCILLGKGNLTSS